VSSPRAGRGCGQLGKAQRSSSEDLAVIQGLDLDVLWTPLSLAVANGAPDQELLGLAPAGDHRQQAMGTAAAPQALPSASAFPAIPPQLDPFNKPQQQEGLISAP